MSKTNIISNVLGVIEHIKIASGNLLSTLKPGVIEYKDGVFYITGAGNRRAISRSSDSIVTPITVADTVVETTVWTGVLVANSLSVKKVLDVKASGQFSTANASDTLTVRLKLNGTTLLSLTSNAGAVTDEPGHMSAYGTVRTIGATGTIASHGMLALGVKSTHANTSSTVVDTTTSNDLTVTAEWSNALAGNTFTFDQGFLEVLCGEEV